MERSSARAFAAPLALAGRRARRHAGPVGLAAAGIAICAAALVTAAVSRTIVEDRAVADAVAALPENQRAVTISWVGSAANEAFAWPRLNEAAMETLATLDLERPTSAVVYTSTRVDGAIVRPAAIERPATALEIRAGRLPEPCRLRRCEVVALDSPARPLASARFVVVGSASARPEIAVDALVGSGAGGGRLVVANGIRALISAPELRDGFRTYIWLSRLAPRDLGLTSSESFEHEIARANSQLQIRSAGFDVRAPIEELRSARSRARVAGSRQLLVGGQCAALFLAFALLAASRIRRRAHETEERLRRFGALRWQVRSEAAAYAATVVVPATLVGSALGALVGASIASAADRSITAVLEPSILSLTGASLVAGLAVGGTVVVFAAIRSRPTEIRGFRLTVADVAAAGALAAVALAFASGRADTEGLSERSSEGTVLLLIPGLITLAGVIVCARLLGPAFRITERLAGRANVSVRLALLSLVRSPGPATVAVVFLVASVSLAVFATTYGTTLADNQRDQAAYAVPLDYRIASDPLRSRSFGPSRPFASVFKSWDPIPVVRRSGEAPTLNRRTSLSVFGIAAGEISRLPWRDDFASASRDELGSRLAGPGDVALRGPPIPRSARAIVLPVSVRGQPIRIFANIRQPDGGFKALELGQAGPRDTRVGAPLPGSARGGVLVGLTIAVPAIEAFGSAHRAAEGDPGPDIFTNGELTLERPRVVIGRRSLGLPVDYRRWVTGDGRRQAGTGTSETIRLRYLLTTKDVFRLRPEQPTDGDPVRVLASSSLEADDGTLLPVRVGSATVAVRVVGTARSFPTLRGDFMVADRAALETAVNAALPGAAVADEVWIEAPPGLTDELRRAAPIPVRVQSRQTIEDRLRADVVSRGSLLALVASSLLALVLALIGVVLLVTVDVRDGARDLFDLEALGFEPQRLANHVWLRVATVVTAGLVGGLLLGAVLAFVVSGTVAVTANATAPEPPLVLAVDWTILAAGSAAFLALALALAGIVARAALSSDRAGAV